MHLFGAVSNMIFILKHARRPVFKGSSQEILLNIAHHVFRLQLFLETVGPVPAESPAAQEGREGQNCLSQTRPHTFPLPPWGLLPGESSPPSLFFTLQVGHTGWSKSRPTIVGLRNTVFLSCVIIYSLVRYFLYEQL